MENNIFPFFESLRCRTKLKFWQRAIQKVRFMQLKFQSRRTTSLGHYFVKKNWKFFVNLLRPHRSVRPPAGLIFCFIPLICIRCVSVRSEECWVLSAGGPRTHPTLTLILILARRAQPRNQLYASIHMCKLPSTGQQLPSAGQLNLM